MKNKGSCICTYFTLWSQLCCQQKKKKKKRIRNIRKACLEMRTRNNAFLINTCRAVGNHSNFSYWSTMSLGLGKWVSQELIDGHVSTVQCFFYWCSFCWFCFKGNIYTLKALWLIIYFSGWFVQGWICWHSWQSLNIIYHSHWYFLGCLQKLWLIVIRVIVIRFRN